MKLILLNTSEMKGGAAVAAHRLHSALLKAGEKAVLLVRDKQSSNRDIIASHHFILKRKIDKLRFLLERIIIFISNRFNKKNLFQISLANTGTDISNYSLILDSDIIHIHWINQGFLSLWDIEKLIKTGKPIIWTLHDLWPVTAICHYPGECKKYKDYCYECPLQVKKPLWDLAKKNYKKKQLIHLSKITFVGCSKWITRLAKESNLLHNAHFLSIPNPIDIFVFKPRDIYEARNKYHIPIDKKILLFAAAKISDERKGFNFLIKACSILKDIGFNNIEILLMGNISEEFNNLFPFKVNSLGYITNEEQMVLAYSCADIFVIPSLEDNLPNTIMEAMACGTPCVGFDTGGIPEMIDHKINGYIAKYKDANDLAHGIQWILENKNTINLFEACIEKVRNNYSEPIIAEKYITLYKSLLENES